MTLTKLNNREQENPLSTPAWSVGESNNIVTFVPSLLNRAESAIGAGGVVVEFTTEIVCDAVYTSWNSEAEEP